MSQIEQYRELFNKEISRGSFKTFNDGDLPEIIAKNYPVKCVDIKFIDDLRMEIIFSIENKYMYISSKLALYIHECQFFSAGNKIMIYKSKKFEANWNNLSFEEKSKYWVDIIKKVERIIVDNVLEY